jgi:hypothetical protein
MARPCRAHALGGGSARRFRPCAGERCADFCREPRRETGRRPYSRARPHGPCSQGGGVRRTPRQCAGRAAALRGLVATAGACGRARAGACRPSGGHWPPDQARAPRHRSLHWRAIGFQAERRRKSSRWPRMAAISCPAGSLALVTAQCPASEGRHTLRHPARGLRKQRGHWQVYDPSAA